MSLFLIVNSAHSVWLDIQAHRQSSVSDIFLGIYDSPIGFSYRTFPTFLEENVAKFLENLSFWASQSGSDSFQEN